MPSRLVHEDSLNHPQFLSLVLFFPSLSKCISFSLKYKLRLKIYHSIFKSQTESLKRNLNLKRTFLGPIWCFL